MLGSPVGTQKWRYKLQFQVYDDVTMISENTKNALSKAVVPAVGVAAAYYLLMCSVFGMDKGLCIVGAVTFGIAIFVGLSLLYKR